MILKKQKKFKMFPTVNHSQNNVSQNVDAFYYTPVPKPTPVRTLLNHLSQFISTNQNETQDQTQQNELQQDDEQEEMEDDLSSLPDLTEDEDEDDEDEDEDENDEELLDTSNILLKQFKHTPKIKNSASNLEAEEDKGKFIGNLDGEASPLNCFLVIFCSIEDELLTTINNRQNQRYTARQIKEGDVGHQITNIDTYDDDRNYYLQRYKNEFTKQDIRSFLSCFLIMGVVKLPKVDDYWNTPSLNGIGMGSYFQHRIKKHKFLEIYRCLDCDVDKFQTILCETFPKVWKLGKVISQDESMMRITARGNLYHINMPKKPIRNGNKFYTSANSLSFIGYFRMHKRTNNEPTDAPLRRKKKTKYVRNNPLPTYSSTKAVTDAMDCIGGVNHIYIVDRYYGSEKLAHEAVQRGQHLIGTCTANRSSAL